MRTPLPSYSDAADATLRMRPSPRCAHCRAAIADVTVGVTAERPDGTLVRHEYCGGLCALALRVDAETGALR